MFPIARRFPLSKAGKLAEEAEAVDDLRMRLIRFGMEGQRRAQKKARKETPRRGGGGGGGEGEERLKRRKSHEGNEDGLVDKRRKKNKLTEKKTPSQSELTMRRSRRLEIAEVRGAKDTVSRQQIEAEEEEEETMRYEEEMTEEEEAKKGEKKKDNVQEEVTGEKEEEENMQVVAAKEKNVAESAHMDDIIESSSNSPEAIKEEVEVKEEVADAEMIAVVDVDEEQLVMMPLVKATADAAEDEADAIFDQSSMKCDAVSSPDDSILRVED